MSEEGSEDSPPRPKRKIKKVMVLSSDSSSDSDEGVAAAGTRRKRLRVLSDEGSDSSGSSVVCVGARRKRALPKLRDSEGDSDTSGWATDHSNAPKPTTSSAKPTSGFASDSSEGNSDKCSICLLRFTNQEVGTPQSCEHIFCLDCITEWSKNVNTCPVDRMTFDFIVVRACAGGRVLRTEPVKVVERRPSVEMLVIEDPTVCEVCGSSTNEETMLLCDGCDLGYHMACLTPPLHEVPIDQWLCPNCDDLLSDVDILFSGITDMEMPLEARHIPIREARSSRMSRNSSISDEPSTSTGRRGNRLNSDDLPTTSRGLRTSHSTRTRSVTTRRKPTTQRRRHKRRRTKTVIIEYEIQESGKFPVTKTVKRKMKKRKSKRRQPRTAARRSHVRASVRAKLQAAGLAGRPARQLAGAGAGLQALGGIPALRLFGDPHHLDYFSDDDGQGVSESASTAVAVRPTSSILSAYRQARRKMISIPSPTHATSAPDVLSSILESQTLLHSKKSVVTISVDGSVNIKVETRETSKLPKKTSQEKEKKQEKLDLSKGEDATKKVPSYPGQSRGGGGWGGGYRGNYHREQGTNNFNNRGGNYENNYNNGGYQNRQGNSNAFHQNNNMRRDDGDAYNNYARRPHQYPPGDEFNFERNRRQASMEPNRGPNMGPNQRHPEHQPGRYSLAPAWQPYTPPPVQHRHSFGGFENPLDMRMGQFARQSSANDALDTDTSQTAKHQTQYRPLPEPPVFKFDKTPEVDKSEDERSDSGLVIDTEKYDPTEPTNDDESGDEEASEGAAPAAPRVPPAPRAATPPAPEQHAVQNILAGLDTSAMNVPPNVLDSAVRAVLKEHRNLLVPAPPPQDRSDDDSEGDCPNFSIYSATSVHIANNADELPQDVPAPAPHDSLEDLVQEDDDVPPDEPSPPPAPLAPALLRLEVNATKKESQRESTKSEEEFKEKVSKRCPITINPRNPIKIKLNTPSLIKRQMSLYDDEEEEVEEEIEPAIAEPSEDEPAPTSTKHYLEKTSGKTDVIKDIPHDAKVKMSLKKGEENSILEDDKEIDNANEIERLCSTPDTEDIPMDTSTSDEKVERTEHEEEAEDEPRRPTTPTDNKSDIDTHSDDENDDLSGTEENDVPLTSQSPLKDAAERNDDILEKMTESISETEDERSYTPCLDENKSKDTSLETEKEKGIEGLDTEMISEDEGNEMFSDTERASPPRAPAPDGEEGEIVDKKKEGPDTKKKKKKETKKEGKEKTKGKNKKSEIAFKKLSKSGKERNYRERDKDKQKNKRERRDSSDAGERERNKQRRKERRKDLERYDVRTVVTEKRRRPKDPFGRDVSPRNARASRDPSGSRSPPRRSAEPPRARRSASPRVRRSISPRVRRTSSPRVRRSTSPRVRRSTSPRVRRSISPRARRSITPRVRRSISPRVRRSISPRVRRSISPRVRRSISPRVRRTSSPRATPPRVRRASSSPRRARPTPSPRSGSRAVSPARAPRRRRRSAERDKRPETRRRRDATRKRRRSASASRSPRPKPAKKKKRVRSERSASRRRSPPAPPRCRRARTVRWGPRPRPSRRRRRARRPRAARRRREAR